MKNFLKILKWLLLLVILFIGFIYISSFVSSCDDENSCCYGHGGYRLSAIDSDKNRITMFSCKVEDNMTDYDVYIQSKKTHNYLLQKLKEDEMNNSKAIIFNRNLILKKFACQVVYWNKCFDDECLNEEVNELDFK